MRMPMDVSRRGFLGRACAIAGTLPLVPALSRDAMASNVAPSAPAAASGYRYLGPADASFTEAMVNTLCQADGLTPDGVTSGLAVAIDACLAAESSVGAHGRCELFRAGITAADRACRQRHGVSLDRLAAADAKQFVRDVEAGTVAADLPLASWLTDVVDPLLKEACFSGLVYDAHGAKVFWKLFG